ncbi:glycerol transporter [Cladophialophora chaetospira]|uniref:Glycerol transporter n=1 Tax=Cladophialophora chaetospira TaxID=386627 RepID=A0AA39CIG2_9EURO|nr:glycerol transporter [Cladophialophora chaetospira]
MTVVSFFRELYSLDTLDTRFTNSSSTPLKLVNEDTKKPGTRDGKAQSTEGSPPRWRTPEFFVYLAVFLFCVPNMYWAVVSVSQPDSPNYSKYAHLLSPGWLFGRKVDNSDAQYAGFRNNIPYLAVLVLLHPFLRRVWERYTLPNQPVLNGSAKPTTSSQAAADTRLQNRLAFDFVSALIYVTALNGFSVLKILLILLINYKIGTALPRNAIPVTTWVFNIGVLFANELAQGYRYSVMSEALVPFFPGIGDWGKILDSYGGLQPRWEVLFNLTVLRMISFNFDYYWSPDRSRAGSPLEKKQLDVSALSERDRVTVPAPASTYTSFRTYVAYVLYPPLYLAGPILTFNDYISQSTYRSPSVSTKRTTLYGIRFLLTLFCMEFLIHTAYMVAISKASPDWSVYTPFQLSMLAYFNLHHIWLKLMIPWRFFRLWALVDGIDPPENMVRCMSDNYSALAFWRSWHRSFNRWTIRYVYVPLGGGPGGGSGRLRGIANMMAVFTFVAIWHDIQLRLLVWGWLVVLFVLPEVAATLAFPASKWKSRPNTYRVICGIGAVGNVLMMMSANLVGFAVGVDGLKSIVHGIASTWQGALFMLTACCTLFVGVQVMFEHREEEKRKGIKLKC